MKEKNGIFLNRGEGKSYWVLGDLYTFKATGKETGGGYTIIDQIIQPNSGPPPHIHRREDEAFYILEGTFSFLCGEKTSLFEAGSFVFVPKGTLHTFRNAGEQKGRLLVIITPAGLEEFFYSLGTPAIDITTPPKFDPDILEKLTQLAETYEMEIPPPNKA